MIKIPSDDPIKYLVYRKFPELVELGQKANGLYDVKSFNSEIDRMPTLETHEWPKLPQIAEEYREKLSLLDKEDVELLYREGVHQQHLEDDKTRFFNKPSASADFEYWSKMSEWTLEEAIVLSFGKNPEIVTWPRLESILSYVSPFVGKCLKLKELVVRAKRADQFTDKPIPIPTDPILPYKFVSWVQANQLDFPNELASKVFRSHLVNKPPKSDLEKTMERIERPSRPSHIDIFKEQLEISMKKVKLKIP